MKAILSALLCLTVSAWCVAADGSGANFIVETHAEGLARVEIRVTGPDLKEPVLSILEAKDGTVSEWVTIPPGGARTIEALLIGAKGEVLALGKATEYVAPKGSATILLTANAAKDGDPIHLVLATEKLTLTQLDKPRKDGRIGVQARLTDAQGKEIPIKKGTITWRDMNLPGPGGASFDPRNPGIGYFAATFAKTEKYKLNVCACLIGQPCRCLPALPRMRYIDVTAGRHHSCAIDQNNHAFCWGEGTSGQLGVAVTTICQIIDPAMVVPTIAFPCSVAPVAVGGSTLFTQISAGDQHTCALDTSGDVWCWGRNHLGQLGNGTISGLFTASPTPARVAAGATKFKEVGAGYSYTCALGTDDLVYCWGRTGCGEDPDPRLASPLAAGTQTFKALSVGPNHRCALMPNGTPMCWGKNDSGQLGSGISHATCAPTPRVANHAPAVVDATRIAAGGESSCIGSASTYNVMDGSISCWGALAPNSGAQHFMTTTVQMSIGGDDSTGTHICAFNPSGTMHCWGSNPRGLLGVGSTQDPVQQPAFLQTSMRFRDLDAGARHTCAINSASEVVCWGGNEHGQLGNASQTASTAPVWPLLFYLPAATFSLEPPHRRIP